MIYNSERAAVLALNNGLVFEGIGLGNSKKVSGEIIFNTIPGSGYVQMLTDPTNRNKIIVCTYPSIGNYGVQAKEQDEYGLLKHFESDSIHPKGVVVSEYCENPSHYESVKTLDDWLFEEDIPAIEWVDTRRLTQYLVENKTIMGVLQVFEKHEKPNIQKLQNEAKELVHEEENHLVKEVSTKEVKDYKSEKNQGTVAIIDLGAKNSIIRILLQNGYNVKLIPYNFSYDHLLTLDIDGLIISNGPGNPKNYGEVIKIIRKLFEEVIPILGIGLGHNLLALAAGAETYKMKSPHLGGRTTVDKLTKKCYITFQNHQYCIKNLKKNDLFTEIYYDKDDNTNEGLMHKQKSIFSVLFNPEGSPGPIDLRDTIFNTFFNYMEE